MTGFFEAIARPFGWLLMLLYVFVQNYGLSLVLIAVIVKVLLLPFQMKSKRGMMRQTRLQPKLAELQKKHAANKQKLNEETAKMYKEEGVNPASGCLWSFIQMPIMIALFYAIRQPLTLMMGVAKDLLDRGEIIFRTLQEVGVDTTTDVFEGFYSEVYIAQEIGNHWDAFKNLSIEGLQNISFYLGRLNLADIPNWRLFLFWNAEGSFSDMWPAYLLLLLPLLSGGAQFVSAAIMRKMSPASSPEAAGGTAGNILKFMPLMSVWFGFILPAALSLYWTIGTILQIAQDIWLTKKYTKILDEEDAQKAVIRKAKDAELEAKRIETERKKAEGLAERNRNTSKRKKSKSNRQDQREKAAEWEKKNAPPEEEKFEPGRVGNRRYARGRAYDPDRFGKLADAESAEIADTTGDEESVSTGLASDEANEYDESETGYSDGDGHDNTDAGSGSGKSGDYGDDGNEYDDDDDSDDYDDSDDDDSDEYDDDYDDDDDNDDYDDDDNDSDDDNSDEQSAERFGTKRFD